MMRSLVLAILTFVTLIFANITVFAFLYFRDLSKTMVTEKLVAGVNDARSLLKQSLESQWDGRLDQQKLSRHIIPRLRQHPQFQALVVLDGQGNVVYRQSINQKKSSTAIETKFLPIDYQDLDLGPQRLVALEYDPTALDREVLMLRRELYRKLGWSVAISGLLLVVGLLYVVWTYKRAQKLQYAAQRADQLAYVGTLASGLAHEIRNPLNSMNMNIQLLQEELEDEGLGQAGEVHEMFESTQREIQRLEKLVSSFLSYARPTSIQTADVSLNRLLESVLEFLSLEIKQREVVLETELSPGLPNLQLDENQVRQALINVIQNALQVLHAGQQLRIVTRLAAGDRVLVEVRDNGPGIAPQELQNIFKVFYSTRRGGTGLGLPIAQRIVEAHGGGIKVNSEVGKGTNVTLIFPKSGREDS